MPDDTKQQKLINDLENPAFYDAQRLEDVCTRAAEEIKRLAKMLKNIEGICKYGPGYRDGDA